ncbi:MAG: alpha-glucan family phosphorylase [bacterium]
MKRPIAYFCAEYAIFSELQTYAGGLGVLAGDYVREMGDEGVPMVAIGLYYSEGFTHKELSPDGKVVDLREASRPEEMGFSLVSDQQGKIILIKLPIQDREVWIRAWRWEYKSVTLFLLDTRVEKNTEQDQHITDTLYTTEKEVRLKQEMILGIGGLRMLLQLKYHPAYYHLNEGHSAFLIYELIHHEMQEHGLAFEEAKERAKKHVLFTNHTLIAAGHDVFSNDLVALTLSHYAEELAIPVKQLVDLGLVQQSSSFSMTMLAMRAAGKINAVSELHAKKAKEIWTDHPMEAITNGIHLPTWDQIGESEIWEKHQENKHKLASLIAEKTGEQWNEKTILLGWARRMVRYKRPLAIVERLKQFREMAKNAERPIHVVFAGVSHPSDTDGQKLLEELQYRLNLDLKGLAVYLPHYNLELARVMTAGCDVWINTPVVGFEACGTSGMKAALNGVLPLSTNDGWMSEVEMLGIGWGLPDTDLTEQMLLTLENKILPLYYERNHEGVPESWVTMMRNARELIINKYSMARVVKQYLEFIATTPSTSLGTR